MDVLTPGRFRKLVKEKAAQTPSSVITKVPKETSKYAAELFNGILAEVIEEAIKGNYYRLGRIDVKRGIDTWIRKQVTSVRQDFVVV